MSTPLRVVLADDSYLVREGTRRLLEADDDVIVVDAVATAAELLEAVDRHEPDAVVTDIRMPSQQDSRTAPPSSERTAGIAAAHAIRARHPRIGIVVLSQYADSLYAFELFKDGTAGLAYLLKDRVGDRVELLRALGDTAAGGSAIDPLVVDGLLRRTARPSGRGVEALTAREIDVLREMAAGRSNSAIGGILHLSESAIEKHISAIFTKLDLAPERDTHRRVAAVLTFLASVRQH